MHYRSSFGLFAACALFAAPSAFAADGDVGGEGSTPDQIAAAYDPTADDQAGADAYATGNYAAAAKACRKIVAAVRKNGGTAWHLVGTNEGHGFAKKENADYQFWTSLLFWKQYLLN